MSGSTLMPPLCPSQGGSVGQRIVLLEVLSLLSDCVAGQILCRRSLPYRLKQLGQMLIVVLTGFQANKLGWLAGQIESSRKMQGERPRAPEVRP